MNREKRMKENVDTFTFRWKASLDEKPSNVREDGFRDAIDPLESWSNAYERGSENWNEYAKGFDEGKKYIREEFGEKEAKEAIIKLLNFVPRHTPESEHYNASNDDPFFTEAYLYALIGKDDARTVLAYLRSVVDKYGFDFRQLNEEAVRKRN